MLTWNTKRFEGYILAEFEADGPLTPAELRVLMLPTEVEGTQRGGIVFSGRGPIWLYAHLCHEAHPWSWTAVHDPRLGHVVVMSHVPWRHVGEVLGI